MPKVCATIFLAQTIKGGSTPKEMGDEGQFTSAAIASICCAHVLPSPPERDKLGLSYISRRKEHSILARPLSVMLRDRGRSPSIVRLPLSQTAGGAISVAKIKQPGVHKANPIWHTSGISNHDSSSQITLAVSAPRKSGNELLKVKFVRWFQVAHSKRPSARSDRMAHRGHECCWISAR
jgi:hypothetical protein